MCATVFFSFTLIGGGGKKKLIRQNLLAAKPQQTVNPVYYWFFFPFFFSSSLRYMRDVLLSSVGNQKWNMWNFGSDWLDILIFEIKSRRRASAASLRSPKSLPTCRCRENHRFSLSELCAGDMDPLLSAHTPTFYRPDVQVCCKYVVPVLK